MRTRKWLASCERGAIAVEFALIAPVMLLLAFGAIHFGIMIGISHSLAQISADAARYAMVGVDAKERSDLVTRYMRDRVEGFDLVRIDNLGHVSREADGTLVVELRYDFTYMPIVPILSAVYTRPDTLLASASTRVR